MAAVVGDMVAARGTDAVTKTKFLNFTSRLSGGEQIFAFEGEDDRIVWAVWIARVKPGCSYEAFQCDGKREARALSRICSRDRGGFNERVWIFVDRDFDDLSDFAHLDHVFCTCRYSIENYFVEPLTLDATLREVFPFNGHPASREQITAIFGDRLHEFHAAMTGVNQRLFLAQRLGIRRTKKLPEKISGFVEVSLDAVTCKAFDLEEQVPMEREPLAEETADLVAEFELLEPTERHRGKFIFKFFQKFLDLLASGCRAGAPEMFSGFETSPLHLGELTLGNHARRSIHPTGLADFLARAPC